MYCIVNATFPETVVLTETLASNLARRILSVPTTARSLPLMPSAMGAAGSAKTLYGSDLYRPPDPTERCVQWPAASYPFRQRLGVYRSCRPRWARQDRRRPSIWLRADRRRRRRKPREGVALGAGPPWQNGYERELQLKAPARNPEHGDLPCTEGGQSADRTMAASL